MKPRRMHASLMLFLLLLLLLALSPLPALAERYVWAAQGETAFFEEDGRLGLLALDGTVLHAAAFDEVTLFDDYGEAVVSVGDSKGILDREGRLRVTPFPCLSMENLVDEATGARYRRVLVSGQPISGTAVYCLLGLDGSVVLKPEWDWIDWPTNGWIFARTGQSWYHLRPHDGGDPQDAPYWDAVTKTAEGFCATADNERVFFDDSGEMVARFLLDATGTGRYGWTDVKPLTGLLFAYEQNGLWGLADETERTLHEPAWLDITADRAPTGLLRVTDAQQRPGWIDAAGQPVSTARWTMHPAQITENRWLVRLQDNRLIIIDDTDAEVADLTDAFDRVENKDGFLRYTKDDASVWGFIDADGKVLSSISYWDMRVIWNGGDSPFSGGYVHIERPDGQEGYVDVYGNPPPSPTGFPPHLFANGLRCAWETPPATFRYAGMGQYDTTTHQTKYGIIDEAGNDVQQPIWDRWFTFSQVGGEWVARVVLRDSEDMLTTGYINERGEPILGIKLPETAPEEAPLQTGQDRPYDYIWPTYNGLAQVERDGWVGLLDEAGRIVLPVEYGMIAHYGTLGRMTAWKPGETCLLSPEGDVLVRIPGAWVAHQLAQSRYARTTDEHLFFQNMRYDPFYRNPYGAYLVVEGGDAADPGAGMDSITFANGHTLEWDDSAQAYRLTAANGLPAGDGPWTDVSPLGSGVTLTASYSQAKTSNVPLRDLSVFSRLALPAGADAARPLTRVLGSARGYMAWDGTDIYDAVWYPDSAFTSTAALVQLDALWGLLDMRGNYLAPPQWEEVGFRAPNMTPVRKDGLWGFIDDAGNLLHDYQWACVAFPSEGFCAVQNQDGLWGFVGAQGQVIPPQWADVGNFSGGLAQVWSEENLAAFLADKGQDDELWIEQASVCQYIDTTGALVDFGWDGQAGLYENGFLAVTRDGLYSILGQDGTLMYPFLFDAVEAIGQDMALVVYQGTYGQVAHDGTVISGIKGVERFEGVRW